MHLCASAPVATFAMSMAVSSAAEASSCPSWLKLSVRTCAEGAERNC